MKKFILAFGVAAIAGGTFLMSFSEGELTDEQKIEQALTAKVDALKAEQNALCLERAREAGITAGQDSLAKLAAIPAASSKGVAKRPTKPAAPATPKAPATPTPPKGDGGKLKDKVGGGTEDGGKLKDKVGTTPAGSESTGGGKLKDKLKGGN
jgi:hypothetical protein